MIDLELSDDIDKTLSHEQINGDISSSQTNKKKSTGPKILVEKEGKHEFVLVGISYKRVTN